MLSVYQHWDPLKVCVVGSCWPPEFFSYIENSYIRNVMEKIAVETQEDLDHFAKWLQDRNVTVLRPNVTGWQDAKETSANSKFRYLLPPVSPRDAHIMIGNNFYLHSGTYRSCFGSEIDVWPGWPSFYQNIKDSSWPECPTEKQFQNLPQHIQEECLRHGYLRYRNDEWFGLTEPKTQNWDVYKHIYEFIESNGNPIIDMSQTQFSPIEYHVGGLITRMGQDLFFGSTDLHAMTDQEHDLADWICGSEFQKHCILTGGHSDATYCAVAPGLIVTYYDRTDFDHSQFSRLFPGWEIVYGDDRSTYRQLPDYYALKKNGFERWLVPGESHNPVLREFIDTYLSHWTGNAAETRFFVNFLMVDAHTAVVAHEDETIIRALERYGITCHVMPFRHVFFWDSGCHCITLDLDRDGIKQSYFHNQ